MTAHTRDWGDSNSQEIKAPVFSAPAHCLTPAVEELLCRAWKKGIPIEKRHPRDVPRIKDHHRAVKPSVLTRIGEHLAEHEDTRDGIAAVFDISVKTVDRALRELRNTGTVTTARHGGRSSVTRYRFTPRA